MSAHPRPTTSRVKRNEQPRLRDVAFAVIAILALLAVLAAAMIVPFARAARSSRVPAHSSRAVGRFGSCQPSQRSASPAACARHEGRRLPARAARGRRTA
jgi:hypothetical protein